MDLETLEKIIRSWSSKVIEADAHSLALWEEEGEGYHCGLSDGYSRCIADIKKILARQRLRIV